MACAIVLTKLVLAASTTSSYNMVMASFVVLLLEPGFRPAHSSTDQEYLINIVNCDVNVLEKYQN